MVRPCILCVSRQSVDTQNFQHNPYWSRRPLQTIDCATHTRMHPQAQTPTPPHGRAPGKHHPCLAVEHCPDLLRELGLLSLGWTGSAYRCTKLHDGPVWNTRMPERRCPHVLCHHTHKLNPHRMPPCACAQQSSKASCMPVRYAASPSASTHVSCATTRTSSTPSHARAPYA
jgi:hypothetical protein